MRNAACSASLQGKPRMWRLLHTTRCMPFSTGAGEAPASPVNDDGVFTAYRDVGLVSEVFPKERLQALGTGSIAVGHVRYGTTGSDNKRNVQPILVNHFKGRMALAHNGNLTNSQELRRELESRGSIFQTTTDSEVIAYLIVQERLKAALSRRRSPPP